jgi:hypothetical protein
MVIPKGLVFAFHHRLVAALFLAALCSGAAAQPAFWADKGVLLRHDPDAKTTQAAAVPLDKPVYDYLGTLAGGRIVVSLGQMELEPGGDVRRGVDIAILSPSGSLESVARENVLRAYPSPQGDRMVILERDYSMTLWSAEGIKPLPLAERVVLVAWAPDGSKLCLTAYPPDWLPSRVTNAPNPDEFLRLNNNDLFLFDPVTATGERLTDAPGYDYSGIFSPDGGAIFFLSGRSGRGAFYRLDLATRAIQPLTNLAPGSYDVPVGRSDTFSWIPETNTIVYEAQEPTMLSSVRAIRADGSAPRLLGEGKCPRVRDGGKTVLFLSPQSSVISLPLD